MQITFSRKSLFALLAAILPASLASGRREASLANAAKRRDQEAFSELVSQNREHVRRFIARRVRDLDRDDVLQETWIRAWEAFPRFDGRSTVRTWLLSVCYHTIQDYWRREHLRPTRVEIFETESSYMPAEFARVELREAMRGYWNSCTPTQRELLSMYYSDGLALPEISRILNRNLNTVKYQFYRAHQEARERLLASAPEEFWEVKK